MSIGEMFLMGGGWMWFIVLLGVVLFVLIVYQFAKIKSTNIVPFLKGIFTALLITGPLGTATGLIQAGWHISEKLSAQGIDPVAASSFWIKAWAIALITTVFSCVLCVIAAILIGLAGQKLKTLERA